MLRQLIAILKTLDPQQIKDLISIFFAKDNGEPRFSAQHDSDPEVLEFKNICKAAGCDEDECDKVAGQIAAKEAA